METFAYQLELRFNENEYDQVTSLLYEVEVTSFSEGEQIRDENGDIQLINEYSVITCFFEAKDQAQKLEELIKLNFSNISSKILEITDDYQNAWKEWAKEVDINERISIIPKWITDSKDINKKITIRIDPAYAFGSGSHPTTIMCLKYLDKYRNIFSEIESSTVIDIGSGSGVLSILASKLGAKSITGIDIDELAVVAAKENAMINDCSNINFSTNTLSNINTEFDIVVVNIISSVITGLLPDILRIVKTNGILIISGLLESETDVLEIPQNFELLESDTLDGWLALSYKLRI